MLSYAEQVRMTEYLTSIYDQIELELLQSLASSFASSQYGGSTEWRVQMLERMGWYNRRNAAIIAKYSGKSQSAVEEIFRDLGAGALTHEETLYQTAFDRGLLPVRPVNPAESAAISQILDAAVDNADNYLNLVNTTCAECARSAYIDVVNKAYIETTTGIKDYTTSIRQAVNKLAKDGITTVTYYRRDGTAIRYPVDAAVRRNILTSIGQTTGKMQIARADEWGCNYMEVTSHAGARPSHAEWQGQVYQINGSSAEYDNLYDATGYGTGDGLKGWNCRHDMYPFIPGISVRGSFPIDLDENEREYNLTQEQRRLEREVRQLRRECVASDALGDKASFMKSSQQLKSKEAELKDFMERTDRTQAARVSTGGFGRSVSQKAVRANKKVQQNIAFQQTLFDRFGIDARGFEVYQGAQSVLDEMVGVIAKLHADFPDDVAKMILRYGNLHDDSTYGEYKHDKKAIYLNSFFFDNTDKLKNSYAEDVRDGYFPKGTDHMSVIVHEFGHQYDYAHNLGTGTMLRDGYRSITGINPNSGRVKNMLRTQVSEYATSDAGKPHTEAIAECFNQWYNSNEQSDICKYVMNKILR